MRTGRKKGAQAIGRSRGGPTTKIHALVDADGQPVRLVLSEGQRHDMTQAPELLRGLRKAYVVADRAYDSDALRAQLRSQRCRAVIHSQKTRKRKRRPNKALYKTRHRVENFFQRVKRYRRIAMRYEKLAKNYLSMVFFAAALTWPL
jgi:transposase